MVDDYENEEDNCILCGRKSGKHLLCDFCYENYKIYVENNENLTYCNKHPKFALIKLFSYFDLHQQRDGGEDKTPFLSDLATLLRPYIQQLEGTDVLPQLFDEVDARTKWPAKYRCNDGHYVRSRAEILIDNWLFEHGIKHVYEKQVVFPNGEKTFCDFYLPDQNAYIEFWGNHNENYLERRKIKAALYRSLKDSKLIELDDKSLENLDDVLQNHIKLLKN